MNLKNNKAFTTSFVLPEGDKLGGVTVWTKQMSEALHELGAPVKLLTHEQDSPENQTPQSHTPSYNSSVPGTCVNIAQYRDLFDFATAYQSVSPTVLIPNYSYATYATAAALSVTAPQSLRTLCFVHSDEAPYYKWAEYYEPVIHRFIAVSDEIAANLAERIPHRSKDIFVKSYPVTASDSPPSDHSTKTETLQLVYSGRIVEKQKLSNNILPLFHQLVNQNTAFSMHIAGGGPYLDELRKAWEKLPKEQQEKLILHGPMEHDKLLNLLKRCHIYISFSEYEGSSISMVEAMGNGCAPVVSDVSGTSKAVDNGISGFTYPVGHIDQMASHIETLASNREKLHQFRVNSWNIAISKYSMAKYLEWLVPFLADTWNSHGRSWPRKRPILPLIEPVDRRYQLAMHNKTPPCTVNAYLADCQEAAISAIQGLRRSQRTRINKAAANAHHVTEMTRMHRRILRLHRWLSSLKQRFYVLQEKQRAAARLNIINKLREKHGRKLAIYGAGQHSRKLIPVMKKHGIQVDIILDDSCIAGNQTMLGTPVCRPIDLQKPEDYTVLLSSDAFESKLNATSNKYNFGKILSIYEYFGTNLDQQLHDEANHLFQTKG